MGKVKNIFLTLLLCITIYYFIQLITIYKKGYSLQEMDWSDKGYTTFNDMLKSIDIGKREVKINNKKCIDYYEYKDGLSIKTVCN
jgi:hypothetical protein